MVNEKLTKLPTRWSFLDHERKHCVHYRLFHASLQNRLHESHKITRSCNVGYVVNGTEAGRARFDRCVGVAEASHEEEVPSSQCLLQCCTLTVINAGPCSK